MIKKFCFVFGNMEIANKLIELGYPLLRVRPNSKDNRQIVYCFDEAALEERNRLLQELGYYKED